MARAAYRYFQRIPTRWMDNDIYGHVNNVVYYSYFDTVINSWLIANAGLDIHQGEQIGLCVESHCRFLAPIVFPEIVEAGLRVEKVSRSSVRYGVGLFIEGQATLAAEGWFVHVFVGRAARASTPIAAHMRAALHTLLVEAPK